MKNENGVPQAQEAALKTAWSLVLRTLVASNQCYSVKQMEQIAKENPQFEPKQYREDLQNSQKLREQVLEENPAIDPVPEGVGGGFF